LKSNKRSELFFWISVTTALKCVWATAYLYLYYVSGNNVRYAPGCLT